MAGNGYLIPLDQVKKDIQQKGLVNTWVDNATGNGQIPQFQPPTYQTGPKAGNTYSAPAIQAGSAYGGALDAAMGGRQVNAMEGALGIKKFDSDAYQGALQAGLQAQADESLRRNMDTVNTQSRSRGLGNSGMAKALEQEARLMSGRTVALGGAQIAGDAAGKKLQEDARRAAMGGDFARAGLQNQQFAAQFGEGQRQFDTGIQNQQAQFRAEQDRQVWAANEAQRLADNSNVYGMNLDQYQMNVIDPMERRDAWKKTGVEMAGTLYGSFPTAIAGA